MFYKVIALVAILVVASALQIDGGHGEHLSDLEHVDYYAHPKYEYKYNIEDPHTGDYKSQHEHRDGDVVKGEYSLLDADGTFRKVQYTSDKHSGFQAIVTKDGHLVHPQPQTHQHY